MRFVIYWQIYSCILWLLWNWIYSTQEVLSKIKDKLITHNIFIIQDNESVICGFNCIAFIEYVVDDKNSKGIHYVSLFIDRYTAVYFDSFGIEYIPHKKY